MSDQAHIHFYLGWADSHAISNDGLPVYVDTVMIDIQRGSLLHLQRPAVAEEFKVYKDEYDAFLRQQKARNATVSESGYPLVMWPALSPAEVETLAVRGVYTVEQLARLAGDRELPGNIADQALRAERLMDMQKNFGKYEAMLNERDAQLAEVQEQLTAARQTIAQQNAVIDTLRVKVA